MLRFLARRPFKTAIGSTAVLAGSAYGYQELKTIYPPYDPRPPVKGYKAFNSDFTCRDHQYKVGRTYTLPKGEVPIPCESGFHFCQFPPDCNSYYPEDRDNRYAEVEAWDVVHQSDKSAAGKLRVVREIPRDTWNHMSGVFVKEDKSTYHMKDGKLHREDGPAVIDANGNQTWYHKGLEHRDDGPAIEWADGQKRWINKGKLHRENGPAIERPNGSKEWWRDGTRYNEDGSLYLWSYLRDN